MEDTPTARRRNGRGEETRRALVEAAVGQLADAGMRGVTHRLVEQRAGQAQGSVKHHFGSLDGLVEAVLEHLVAVDLPLVMEPATDDVPTLVAQAQAVMDAVWARPELARARLALYVHAGGRPELQEVVGRAREQFVTAIARSMPGPDAELGARFVAALLDGLVLDELSAPSDALRDGAGRLVVHAGYAGRLVASRALDGAPHPHQHEKESPTWHD